MSYRVFEQCALATVSSVLAVVSMAVEDDVDGAMPIERNTTTLPNFATKYKKISHNNYL